MNNIKKEHNLTKYLYIVIVIILLIVVYLGYKTGLKMED